MPTVTITGNDYDVYSDVATADEYLAADFTATQWRAETDAEQKARAKVTAYRTLNQLSWRGDKTDPDQGPAFPRTGMGLSDIDDDEIPQEILDAENLLAKYVHNGTVSTSASTTASGVKRQKAGSVEIEYFNPLMVSDPTLFPEDVMDLIRRFLGGDRLVGGSIAYGTCTPSGFNPDYSVSGPA